MTRTRKSRVKLVIAAILAAFGLASATPITASASSDSTGCIRARTTLNWKGKPVQYYSIILQVRHKKDPHAGGTSYTKLVYNQQYPRVSVPYAQVRVPAGVYYAKLSYGDGTLYKVKVTVRPRQEVTYNVAVNATPQSLGLKVKAVNGSC